MELRNKRRLQLVLIAAVFVVPVVIALGLTSFGWVPAAHSYGQPIQPERDLANVPVTLAGGQPFSWSNHDAVWTLVALPGPDCAKRCLDTLDLVHRAQISLGEHAGKLRLLYLGDPPDDVMAKGFGKVWTVATAPSGGLEKLRAHEDDSVSAVLVTPTGKAFIRYATNFDPRGLRADLAKVVH